MKKTLLSGLFLMVSLMVLGCGGEKAAAPAADASAALGCAAALCAAIQSHPGRLQHAACVYEAGVHVCTPGGRPRQHRRHASPLQSTHPQGHCWQGPTGTH